MTWTGLASGDVGSALNAPNLPDKTVHVTGVYNTATVVIEGSNSATSATDFITLTDPSDNALSFASGTVDEHLEQIMQNPRRIRPSLGTAGGSASVTVYIVSRSSK